MLNSINPTHLQTVNKTQQARETMTFLVDVLLLALTCMSIYQYLKKNFSKGPENETV